MKINNRKLLILPVFFLLFSALSFQTTVLAQGGFSGAGSSDSFGAENEYPCPKGEYCALESLPGGVTTQGQAVKLADYLTNIIKLTIGIAVALTVIMIIVGGFQYISTDAMSGKSEGKEKIKNALAGLTLALLSYAILYTLGGEKLTNFNLSIEAVAPTSTAATLAGANNDGLSMCPARARDFNDVQPGTPYGRRPCSCQNCTNTFDLDFGANTDHFMNADLLAKLLIMKTKATKLVGNGNLIREVPIAWAITEAWKPRVPHVDSCHYNGTCVDANLTTNKYTGGVPSRATVEDINAMYAAARQAGLRIIFEVSQSDMNALRSAGVNQGVLHSLYETTTAPSFHIY